MKHFRPAHLIAATAMIALCGCGTYVPSIQEYGESERGTRLSSGGLLEYRIKDRVYCEVVEAAVESRDAQMLPAGWAAQVTLDMQVDEIGAVNPGISLIRPIDAVQTFTFGVGATLSSQGTREDKFGSYWNLDRLKKPCPGAKSYRGSSLLLQGDLGIVQWLKDSLATEQLIPSSDLSKQSDSVFKQDFLSYHVKFIVITNGNATPTWKLVRLATGNGALPLASVSRTRTHDLLVTFGPAYKVGSPNLAVTSHTIQEFGIAASNGNTSALAPLLTR